MEAVMRDIVNERDEIVGRATREEVAGGRLICRVAFVMLVNSNGEFLLQQRSAKKNTYPLYWSGAAAGHLASGETYEAGARRELKEELGIEVPLKYVGKFYSEPDREMVGAFLGCYDGPVQVERHEVERIAHFSPQHLAGKPNMRITSFVKRSLPIILPQLSALSLPSGHRSTGHDHG
ncbi:NUDIX hydrolase [Plantactinospora sp. WMMC1484]|uniref:NUDIX hydrolase n=1 Tax=Plantactinospora sp. WMMC1484 TaxID=3404122 RepID=UPI003BF531E0